MRAGPKWSYTRYVPRWSDSETYKTLKDFPLSTFSTLCLPVSTTSSTFPPSSPLCLQPKIYASFVYHCRRVKFWTAEWDLLRRMNSSQQSILCQFDPHQTTKKIRKVVYIKAVAFRYSFTKTPHSSSVEKKQDAWCRFGTARTAVVIVIMYKSY